MIAALLTACASGDGGPATYAFLLIKDEEDPATTGASATAGADIDAVQVMMGGELRAAAVVEGSGFGSGDNSSASTASDALGAPDSECGVGDPGYVSLGGEDGGYLILSFGADLSTGDTVTVTECGGSSWNTAELYDVRVGNDGLFGTDWVLCGDDLSAIDECFVP